MTIAAILLAGVTGKLTADWPPSANLSEQQPPTAEDWFRYYLRRTHRCRCDYLCVEPIVLTREILYYTCCEPVCGEPVHRSFRGVYGVRHPLPYYLPEIEIVVPVPGCCPLCAPQGLPSPFRPTILFEPLTKTSD
jgi:hypothetical protein